MRLTTGGTTTRYEYAADGIRSKKTVGSTVHSYVTQNGKVIRETIGTTKVLDFIYDANGRPFALNYSTNGGATFTTYYYMLNHQGDVIALMKSDYTIVARYIYNAWGEIIDVVDGSYTSITSSTNIALVNPLRYRGYYYDTETGFYYLQSRYYDPVSHRFINADFPEYAALSTVIPLGTNLFAYCQNNPVIAKDQNGEWLNIVIGAVVGAVVGAVTTIATAVNNNEEIDWVDVVISAGVGATSGAVAATGLGAIAQAGITAAATATGNMVQQVADNIQGDRNGYSVVELVCAGATGFATSIMGSAAGKLVTGKMSALGESMVAKGRGNMLTGYIRQQAGQSGSSLMRHGAKLVAKGTQIVNKARGISSVVGTLATVRENALFGELFS